MVERGVLCAGLNASLLSMDPGMAVLLLERVKYLYLLSNPLEKRRKIFVSLMFSYKHTLILI